MTQRQSPTATIVDIHTHVYTPLFMEILRSRDAVPYIRSFPPDTSDRLIILPGEDSPDTPATSRGRPIGPDYYDISKKIEFMDTHGIDISVISLANPWLDFLPTEDALRVTQQVNDELNNLCASYPGRLYAFGALPLSGSVAEVIQEIKRLAQLRYVRGVIMGTSGLGDGLDDPRLDSVWGALQETKQTIFLHPHYGLPKEVYGSRQDNYGHVLALAMGFPMETTIAVARMFLSGVWDKWTKLSVLLAHSGGTLPFLAGRLESCILHDRHIMEKGKDEKRRTIWDILQNNILLDSVVYARAGLKAATEVAGSDRILFGTDHPFFPPLTNEEGGKEEQWLSVTMNYRAVQEEFEPKTLDGILGGNAIRLLRLE
ncbi:amidohydrolase 2 [Terfezia boudieri ATCC MYA-4762]|uniref:Amidohydrolase 2 n=1 Tax=Terfezia boudieri ATCC MYA-4762 TaxID=1051890 RepID=A0A3N4LI41_9PEZI|nr:amidohydrolase 2 [Terfezia boudieri ATCC MYA-4762]